VAPDASTVDFAAILHGERAELLARLAELGFGDAGGPAYDPNFADTSQVTAERGEAEALAQSLQETLSEVEHAIAKLADGTFGVCERCHRPISAARLEAKPAARLCIECASRP